MKFGLTEGLIQSVSYSFLQSGTFLVILYHKEEYSKVNISIYIYVMCAYGLSSIIWHNEKAGSLH